MGTQMEHCSKGRSNEMPFAQYFFFAGGVLLTLLLISDAYLPKLPVTDRANPDLPVIRIHSDRKWPERVVYNTNLPTIIPAHIANTDSLPAPTTVGDVSTNAREAFAQLQPSDAKQLPSSDPKKREPTLQRQRKIAKRPPAPPTIRLAQRPQFVFFGRSIW
jgi:hypothetical protein